MRYRRRASDYYQAAEATLLFGFCDVVFRLPSSWVLSRLLATAVEGNPSRTANLHTARRLRQVVMRIAAIWPTKPECLQRSLVLIWLLRRRHLPAQLRISAVPGEDGLLAHAWVTSGDVSLDYIPWRFPPLARSALQANGTLAAE